MHCQLHVGDRLGGCPLSVALMSHVLVLYPLCTRVPLTSRSCWHICPVRLCLTVSVLATASVSVPVCLCLSVRPPCVSLCPSVSQSVCASVRLCVC